MRNKERCDGEAGGVRAEIDSRLSDRAAVVGPGRRIRKTSGQRTLFGEREEIFSKVRFDDYSEREPRLLLPSRAESSGLGQLDHQSKRVGRGIRASHLRPQSVCPKCFHHNRRIKPTWFHHASHPGVRVSIGGHPPDKVKIRVTRDKAKSNSGHVYWVRTIRQWTEEQTWRSGATRPIMSPASDRKSGQGLQSSAYGTLLENARRDELG